MTPAQREDMIAGLGAHVAAKLPHVGGTPETPRGCAVLLALDVLGAAVALGPFDIPELGIRVWDVGGKRQ